MKFLDRQAEMRRLVRLHEEGRGGFVAVWGRRRLLATGGTMVAGNGA